MYIVQCTLYTVQGVLAVYVHCTLYNSVAVCVNVYIVQGVSGLVYALYRAFLAVFVLCTLCRVFLAVYVQCTLYREFLAMYVHCIGCF